MENELIKLCFKKIYPDNIDKEYYYFRINAEHEFIKQPHIIADTFSNTISIFCKEPTNKVNGASIGASKNDVCLYFDKLNNDNLIKALRFFFL